MEEDSFDEEYMEENETQNKTPENRNQQLCLGFATPRRQLMPRQVERLLMPAQPKINNLNEGARVHLIPASPRLARPTPMPRRNLALMPINSTTLLVKQSLRCLFQMKQNNCHFQLLEVKPFGNEKNVTRLAISDTEDITVNVLAGPTLKEKIEKIKNKPIINLKKHHIRNKCVIIVEDFEVVSEDILDIIGSPSKIENSFYATLRNHKGWPVTPSAMTKLIRY